MSPATLRNVTFGVYLAKVATLPVVGLVYPGELSDDFCVDPFELAKTTTLPPEGEVAELFPGRESVFLLDGFELVPSIKSAIVV